MTDNLELLNIKDKLASLLLSSNTGNQIGVGVNEKEDMIRVYLRQETEKGKQHVQNLIGGNTANGYEIQYILANHIQALQCSYSRTEYTRPICGGSSISHLKVSAGTLGTVVIDNNTGKRYGLSNNHVLSNSTSNIYNNANVGDQIFSPGCYDSGGCTYPIGTLERYIPFNEYEMNFVDCALVTPDTDIDISDEINGIGLVEYHKEPKEGMYVQKSGRTTGVTNGQVIDINATMEVDYNSRILRFDNCIVTGSMAAGGDSGSILNDSSDNKAVGLLFAGSDQLTIYNRMSYVLSALNIKMSSKDTISTEYIPQVAATDIVYGVTQFGSVAFGIAAIGLASKYVLDIVTKHT